MTLIPAAQWLWARGEWYPRKKQLQQPPRRGDRCCHPEARGKHHWRRCLEYTQLIETHKRWSALTHHTVFNTSLLDSTTMYFTPSRRWVLSSVKLDELYQLAPSPVEGVDIRQVSTSIPNIFSTKSCCYLKTQHEPCACALCILQSSKYSMSTHKHMT